MRKIYSLFLVMLMLPVLAMAADNLALSKEHNGGSYSNTSPTTNTETRILIPFSAIEMPQDAQTTSDPGYDFSIGMWFKTTAIYTNNNPKVGILFRMGTGSHNNNNGAIQAYTDSNGALTLTFRADNIGNDNADLSIGSATLNEWHHLMLVFDSSNGSARAYVDGEKTAENTTVGKFAYQGTDGVFQFCELSYSGAFDEIQLYSAALTDEDVAKAYINAQSVDNLASLFTFDTVKDGTTGQFESVAGSASDAIATYQNCAYQNYWAEGQANLTTQTETAPTLVEGRELPAMDVTLYVMDGEGGTITVTDGENTYDGESAAEGVIVNTTNVLTITATPEDGYQLIGIYAVDPVSGARTEIIGGTYTPTGDVIITALFTNTTHALTVDNTEEIPYTITRSGETITDLTTLLSGAEYTLTLNVPDTKVLNAVRLGDEELTANNGSYTFILDSDATLTIDARAKYNYTVTITQPENGSIIVANGTTAIFNGDEVLENSTLSLYATPKEGYQLSKILVNDQDYSTSTIIIDNDIEISAIFEARPSASYNTPSGSAVDSNGYVESITTTGANRDINITRSQKNGTIYELCDGEDEIIEVMQGQSFSMNLYAHHANTNLNTVPSPQDLRYCMAFIFADWDGDGSFEFIHKYGLGCNESGFGGSGTNANVSANYESVMDINHSFDVPNDAAIGRSRIRVIYSEAWDTNTYDGKAVQAGAIIPGDYTGIQKGYSYDFCIDITPAQSNTLSIITTGQGSVEAWTAISSSNPNKPAGTQINNSGTLPIYNAITDILEGNQDFIFAIIPSENHSIESVTISNGDQTIDAELIPMDDNFEAYKNNSTCLVRLPKNSIQGDVTLSATFSDNSQGIDEIGIDEANGPVEYYNLQGVRVASENLVPGFYIVRQGSKTAKVLIRK